MHHDSFHLEPFIITFPIQFLDAHPENMRIEDITDRINDMDVKGNYP
jgi:hypothetical protein